MQAGGRKTSVNNEEGRKGLDEVVASQARQASSVHGKLHGTSSPLNEVSSSANSFIAEF